MHRKTILKICPETKNWTETALGPRPSRLLCGGARPSEGLLWPGPLASAQRAGLPIHSAFWPRAELGFHQGRPMRVGIIQRTRARCARSKPSEREPAPKTLVSSLPSRRSPPASLSPARSSPAARERGSPAAATATHQRGARALLFLFPYSSQSPSTERSERCGGTLPFPFSREEEESCRSAPWPCSSPVARPPCVVGAPPSRDLGTVANPHLFAFLFLFFFFLLCFGFDPI